MHSEEPQAPPTEGQTIPPEEQILPSGGGTIPSPEQQTMPSEGQGHRIWPTNDASTE